MALSNEIKLSVIVPVYNHEKYLKKCIESILMQKVNFSFDVWIGDDCSTDNSSSLLKEIEKKSPNNFHFIYRDVNIYPNNAHDLINRSSGEYVATLEGDDYWIDPYKLQKQVDYLDKNPDCSAVYHECVVVDQNGQKNGEVYPTSKQDFYSFHEFERRYLPGQTGTCVRRRTFYSLKREFDENYKLYDFYPGDQLSAFLLLFIGRVKTMHETMSAYRHVVLPDSSSYSATYVRNGKVRRDELLFYKSIKMFSQAQDNKDAYLVSGKMYYHIYLRRCLDGSGRYSFKSFFSELQQEDRRLYFLLCAVAKTTILQFKRILRFKNPAI